MSLGESVRLKRPMRRLGGSVRLKRPMRHMGGMCALCAIWVSVGAGFRVLDFGPGGCGPSSADGGSPVDKAEGHQLFESQVDMDLRLRVSP